AVGVGAYPFDHPAPLGAALKSLEHLSSVSLALRNTPRVVPLLALGMAVPLAAGLAGLARHWRRAAIAGAVAVGLLAIANMPPLWQGTFVDRNLRRPERLPAHW